MPLPESTIIPGPDDPRDIEASMETGVPGVESMAESPATNIICFVGCVSIMGETDGPTSLRAKVRPSVLRAGIGENFGGKRLGSVCNDFSDSGAEDSRDIGWEE